MNYYIDFDHTLFDTQRLIESQKIENCSDYLFNDSVSFLKKLKSNGHKLYMLSYGGNDLQYQISKIYSCNIVNYFDGIFITKDLKFNIKIDYSNGIFIDDNPRDLIGLYSKNAKKVIRLRRKNQKYSSEDLNINIEEYENFDEIPLDLED